MSKKTEIRYETSDSLAGLQAKVNSLITHYGFQPYGVVVVSQDHFIQTMVKYEEREKRSEK